MDLEGKLNIGIQMCAYNFRQQALGNLRNVIPYSQSFLRLSKIFGARFALWVVHGFGTDVVVHVLLEVSSPSSLVVYISV